MYRARARTSQRLCCQSRQTRLFCNFDHSKHKIEEPFLSCERGGVEFDCVEIRKEEKSWTRYSTVSLMFQSILTFFLQLPDQYDCTITTQKSQLY
jgi:hypothetical protein